MFSLTLWTLLNRQVIFLKVLFNAYLADLIIFLGFGSVKLQKNVFNNLTIFLPNSGVLVLETLFLPFYWDANPGFIFNAWSETPFDLPFCILSYLKFSL